MNLSLKEQVAEIRGFFHAFEWVNHKTDHGYSFDISMADDTGRLEEDVARHFALHSPKSILLQHQRNWRETLFQTLKRWLFSYLNDPSSIGRLTDNSRMFSLSFESYATDMLQEVVVKIEALADVSSLTEIIIGETEGHYACESTDLVLVTSGPLIFLHFEVSD